MLYDPFTPTTTRQNPATTSIDTVKMTLPSSTSTPSRTKPIDIPTKTAPQPSLYADYTDYGEVFFEDPFDYDTTLSDMIKLERVPNRRDSGYETPSSPVEKLQHEEHHVQEGIPTVWAGEHDVSHHLDVSVHRSHPRRRSSLLLTPPQTPGDISPKDARPLEHAHGHEAAWPSQTIDRCQTCKWKYLTWPYTPPTSSGCICQSPPETPMQRARRDACGEEESLARMSRFVEEHLSWPAEL